MEHELSIYRLCHKAAPKEVEVGEVEVEAVEVEEVEVEVEVGEAEAAEAEEGALSEEVVEVVVVRKRYLKQAAFIPNLSSLKLMQ